MPTEHRWFLLVFARDLSLNRSLCLRLCDVFVDQTWSALYNEFSCDFFYYSFYLVSMFSIS